MTKAPLPVYSVRIEADGPTVYRDEKPLETPRNLPVTVPTVRLAEAILAECQAQGEKLDLRKMPMTQMTLTSLDITAKQRKEIIAGILRFGESELICQRATEPPDLVDLQNAGWKPYLDWARYELKADLRMGNGIVPFEQNPEALAALRVVVEKFGTFALTGVSEAVGVSGSLVLGLALATRHADVEAVFAAAELDQLWQIKRWGEDPAMAGIHAEIKRDLTDCARWLSLLD
jgi:chaperone required for assembly of F1-ATPase